MIKLEEKFNRFYETLLIEDIAAVRKQYIDINDVDFETLINADPTFTHNNSVGKFTKWILNQFKKNNLTITPDGVLFYNGGAPTAIWDVLSGYVNALKNTDIEKDINRFKTPSELFMAVENAQPKELSDRQKERQMRRAFKDAKLVYEDNDWTIYIPETYEADCTLGKGSGWCTADSRTRTHYDKYLNENGGQYYILISKFKPIERYQFHFESDQFFGAGTNQGHTPNQEYDISYKEFANKYPKVKEFFDKQGYDENYVSNVFNPRRALENYFNTAGQVESGADGTVYAYAELQLEDLMDCHVIDPCETLEGIVKANRYTYFEDISDTYSEFGATLVYDINKLDQLNKLFNDVNKDIGYNVLPLLNTAEDLDNDMVLEILMNGTNDSLSNVDIRSFMCKLWFAPLSGMEYNEDDDYCKFYANFNELTGYFEIPDYIEMSNDRYIDEVINEAQEKVGSDVTLDDEDAIVLVAEDDYINGRFRDMLNKYPNTIYLYISTVMSNKLFLEYVERDLAIAVYDYLEENNKNIENYEKFVEPEKDETIVNSGVDDDDSIPF